MGGVAESAEHEEVQCVMARTRRALEAGLGLAEAADVLARCAPDGQPRTLTELVVFANRLAVEGGLAEPLAQSLLAYAKARRSAPPPSVSGIPSLPGR